MKKLLYPVLLISFVCFGGLMHGMKCKNSTSLTIRNPKYLNQSNSTQESESLWLPDEVITHIAGYCNPKGKNTLMRLSKAFCKCVKDRGSIIQANPSTVSLSDKEKETFKSAYANKLEMMNFLLTHGVSASIKNILGMNLFHIMSDNKNIEAMQLLVDHKINVHELKPQVQPLHDAAYHGNKEMVEKLLAFSIDPNVAFANGTTALMIASARGHTDIVKLLLNTQAYVNHSDNNVVSALMRASQNGHTEIVKLLLDAGANANRVNNNGCTALMAASQNGHTEIVKLLLDAGVNVNRANDNGWTAVMAASQNGHTEIVKLLLAAQANVNYAYNNGMTALISASQNGNTDIVKLLLAAGVNVNRANDNGWTALMYASNNGHTEIVKLLLAAQANVNYAYNNGCYAENI